MGVSLNATRGWTFKPSKFRWIKLPAELNELLYKLDKLINYKILNIRYISLT